MKQPNSILITGATSGIGEALALHYARTYKDNICLFLSGRNRERLDKVVEQCRTFGTEARGEICDVTDREAMTSWIKACHEHKSLDLVIANAGISAGTGGCDYAEPDEQVRMIMAVNWEGVLNTVHPALDLMIEQKHGQIALMSSLASFSGWPGAPAYSASKAAVRVYAEALRGAVSGSGVDVNVICPGFIRTPLTDINNYKMPFLMNSSKTAVIIARGLSKNVGRIAFPWPTYLLAGFFGILPHWISSLFFKKLPQKISK